MVVIVKRQGYDQIVEEFMELNVEPVSKEAYQTTYDLNIKDIRIDQVNVKDKFKNACLSQVKYYLNWVWVKIVGLPREMEVDNYSVQPKDHGGSEKITIKQLIMEDKY